MWNIHKLQIPKINFQEIFSFTETFVMAFNELLTKNIGQSRSM